MRAADLGAARVAIWGLGREGRAAIGWLRARHPNLPLLLLDDAEDASAPAGLDRIQCAFGAAHVARALGQIDVLVKSPGVSLYRPEIAVARGNAVKITSLLNLWFAENFGLATICVTGTKGKSTTASLIAHMLGQLGRRVELTGNIGVPITEIDPAAADYAVIEVSSYQAADFGGVCDVAVLTSLYPEHIDWHRTLDVYYRDKLNLLRRSRCAIVNRETALALDRLREAPPPDIDFFNQRHGVHPLGSDIFDGNRRVGEVGNRYLARPHNVSNLCAALTVAKRLGLDLPAALSATGDFRPLPHRQQELGEASGVLFVDDSISTAPESTLAALEVYAGHDIAVIVGGYDRGIDYHKLIVALAAGAARWVICLGASGERIHAGLRAANGARRETAPAAFRAQSMDDAVGYAKQVTAPGSVVLLSPAAPSYGYYRDFAERGRDFAEKVALPAGAGQTL
ncbi:MAG TPA: UDP-N-acetylmuramoyl-L-alanine--D-glutamate ligase [Stellaceae bacterium]|jgi:UDP-N-acetylmuramoylalanine--D-glutamate ligase